MIELTQMSLCTVKSALEMENLQENEIKFVEHTTLTSFGHAVVINLSALSGFV